MHKCRCPRDGIFHHWHELLAELYAQVLEVFLCLVQLCLCALVCTVKLIHHRLPGCVCRICRVLCGHHVTELIGQYRQHLHGTASAKSHLVEHRSELIKSALPLHRGKELEQGLVGIGLQHGRELLHVHACELCEFCRLLEHGRNQLVERSGRHLHLLHVLVEDGTEAHNLWYCHPCLFGHARHTGSELHEITATG